MVFRGVGRWKGRAFVSGWTAARLPVTLMALLTSTALVAACGGGSANGSGGTGTTTGGGGTTSGGCATGTAAQGTQLSVAQEPDSGVATPTGNCWAGIKPTTVTVADIGTQPSNTSTTFKVAWSAKNLYVMTYTTEWPLSNAGGTNWWQSDATEIDVSGVDDHGGQMDTSNTFQFGVVEDGTLQQGNNASGASPQPTPIAKVVQNKGFYTELVVPWSTLQVSKPAKGQKYQFDLGQDYDDGNGNRAAQIVWQADPSKASSSDWHQDTSQWGDITLN